MHFVFWTFFIWSTVTDQRLEIRKCDQPTYQLTNQPTKQPTNQLTWVGARDTCVSKKKPKMKKLKVNWEIEEGILNEIDNTCWYVHCFHCYLDYM